MEQLYCQQLGAKEEDGEAETSLRGAVLFQLTMKGSTLEN